MYMVLHLYRENYLDDILMAMTQAGIEETVVLSGESFGHKLTFGMPLFAGFRNTIGSEKGYSNVIMGKAKQEQIDYLLDELKNANVNFIEDEIGKIILLPIEKEY